MDVSNFANRSVTFPFWERIQADEVVDPKIVHTLRTKEMYVETLRMGAET